MIKKTIETCILAETLSVYKSIDENSIKFKPGERVKVKGENNINGWVFWGMIMPGDYEPTYGFVTEGFKKTWWSKESDLEIMKPEYKESVDKPEVK